MRFLRTSLVVCFLAALLLAACGGSSNAVGGETDAQPRPQGSTFESGEFSGLPMPDLATPYGELTTSDNVTTQTFKIKGRTPKQVLEFYLQSLTDNGWATVQEPQAKGRTDWVGTWTDDAGRRLEVSSAPIKEGNPDSVQSQFSLVLHGS